MSKDRKASDDRWRVLLTIGGISLATLPLLYVAFVLAAGPFTVLVNHGYMSNATYKRIDWFYGPVYWLMERCAWLNQFIEWYMSLWQW